MPSDLILVMPVYNESECITRVISSWSDMLASLHIRYRLIVLNDGSRDDTAARLESFRTDKNIEIIHKENAGHGPTILLGYRRAVQLSEWVFQTDSDDEISPIHFRSFWKNRDGYDAIFGVRQHRSRSIARRAISQAARFAVRVLYSGGIHDVNVPYRLIRAAALKQLIASLPPDTFAPNVIVSGAIARSGLRFLEIPIPCEGRRTGSVSIARWGLWKAVARSLVQTISCRQLVARDGR
jgi:glycosyltransferase involved in cell wall biosynthesis